MRTWCRSRRDLPDSFATDLTRGADGPLPADDLHTEILGALLRGGATGKCSPAVWDAWRPVLRRLLDEDPTAASALFKVVSVPRSRAAAKLSEAAASWLTYLTDLGLRDRLTGETDDALSVTEAQRWLTLFLKGYDGMRLPVAGLEPVLRGIAARARAAGEPRDPWDGLALRRDNSGRQGVRLDLLAVLIRAGMPFKDLAHWRRLGLAQWMDHHGPEAVGALLDDPVLSRRVRTELTGEVRDDLRFTGTRHPLVTSPLATARLMEFAPLREVVVCLVEERLRKLGDSDAHALFAFQDLMVQVEPFVLAGAGRPFDSAVRAALGADLADVLARTLAARCAERTHGNAQPLCPVRTLTAAQARELLASAGDELRDLCAAEFDKEPAQRTARYLNLDNPRLLDLLEPLRGKIPGLLDEGCLQRFAGALTTTVACEVWQRKLRSRARERGVREEKEAFDG